MAKFKDVSKTITITIKHDELTKYHKALQAIIGTFKIDFGKIGEHGNSILKLERDFNEIIDTVRDY